MNLNLTSIRQLPIIEVASRLGIKVLRGNKAMCFGGHDKLTPSLSFHPSKNIWKCFGCELKGDTIKLVMAALNCDFKASLSWFEASFGLHAERTIGTRQQTHQSRAIARSAPCITTSGGSTAQFAPDPDVYSWFLSKCGPISQPTGLDYLRDHGISRDTATRFGLRELRNPSRALNELVKKWGSARVYRSGLAFGDSRSLRCLIWRSYALLFPFYANDNVIFIQGRLFRGPTKYLNPKGIPKPLFNAGRIGRLHHGTLICICEGAPDALAVESTGHAAVGVLGASSFKAEWVEQFLPLDVVVVPDGDRAGSGFRKTIARLFKSRGRVLRSIKIPDGIDIATFLAGRGKVNCLLSKTS
jgi:DNA primase